MNKKEFEQAQKIRSEVDEAVKSNTSEEKKTPVADLQRRRTLIAALAAAPAVLSLMNRSAWGGAAPAFVSCALVASYVHAGNKWQSPRPINGNGTLAIRPEDIDHCK